MKATLTTIIATLVAATPVVAVTGSETEPSGLLLYLFMGFGALVIVCQLVPGLMLLGAMLKGFLSGPETEKQVIGTR